MEKLSIIMPVYNEITTIQVVLEGLLALKLPSLEKELIIVESNSTDGTRDVILQYKDTPEVQIVLEEKPKGKGHAVRTGLKHATGTYIAIQDGDLEYDWNDYPKLLEPLQNGTASFVLGSRHSEKRRSWKIRKFEGAKLLQHYCNIGHVLFTSMFNVVYGKKLKDPFTMYKIFKKQCIEGITFTSNRFDFDWELLCKLCRKGYEPLEIPVHYASRSTKEGKKVLMFKDPITWFIACFKFRFCKI